MPLQLNPTTPLYPIADRIPSEKYWRGVDPPPDIKGKREAAYPSWEIRRAAPSDRQDKMTGQPYARKNISFDMEKVMKMRQKLAPNRGNMRPQIGYQWGIHGTHTER